MKRILFFFILMAMPLWGEPVRSSSHPYISGDTFRAFCDFIFDETQLHLNVDEIGEKSTIFVKTDYLEEFFKHYHPQIKYPYILVTHNSDYGIPGPHASFLDDPKLIGWFGQNVESYHPKLHPLPIGFANSHWPHGNTAIIDEVRRKKKKKRPIVLYLNFQVVTCSGERQHVFDLFSVKPYCRVDQPKDFKTYLNDLAQTKFVLSPRGNGLDCHRTWEAILMGAIPIVKSSTLDPLFKDLPVLIVKDWQDINKKFLRRAWSKLILKRINPNKAFADYWFAEINKARGR